MDEWDNLEANQKYVLLEEYFSEDKPGESEKLAKMAQDRSTTIANLISEIEFFKSSPQFSGKGKAIKEDLGGSPDATYFTLGAKKISYLDAFCEILDGIIENHDNLNDEKKVTDVKFTLSGDGEKRMMILEENSGGIKRKNLDSIAKLGESGWGNFYGVGVFGVGLKKGLRKIGAKHHIFTWHNDDSTPVEIEFSNNFWENVGTEKGLTKATECDDKNMLKKEGYTIIHFHDFENYPNEELVFDDNFVSKISRYYQQWLDSVKGTINISFKQGSSDEINMGDHLVDIFSDNVIERDFSYHPLFEPRQFVHEFKGPPDNVNGKIKKGNVAISVKFGLKKSANNWKESAGVYVFGNDRFFHGPATDTAFGFGSTGDFGKISNYHAEKSRFWVKVDIKAENALDIPWNVGEKNGYNKSHPTHAIITNMVQCAAKIYMPFNEAADSVQIESFGRNGCLTDSETLDKLIPNLKSNKKSKAYKTCLSLIENFKPRVELLYEPIEFSEINTQNQSSGTWSPKQNNSFRTILTKKKKSDKQNNNDITDEDFLKSILSGFQKPSTPSSAATTTPATTTATPPAATTTPGHISSTGGLVDLDEYLINKIKKTPITTNNKEVRFTIPTEEYQTIISQSTFDSKDEKAMFMKLLCHYMLTKKQFHNNLKNNRIPKLKGDAKTINNQFKNWVKKEKWKKKK